MLHIIRIFALLLSTIACAQPTPESDLSPQDAEKMINSSDIVILDVRTDEEYEKGHLRDARHMDYYLEDFEENVSELPTDKTYLLYCHSGYRSKKAYNFMKEKGFENIHNLQGGIEAWVEAGNDLQKE